MPFMSSGLGNHPWYEREVEDHSSGAVHVPSPHLYVLSLDKEQRR